MNKEQALKVALNYFKGYPSKNEVVVTTDGQAFHSDNGGAARIHQEKLGGVSFKFSRKEAEASEKPAFEAPSQELMDYLKVLAANGLSGKILAKISVAGDVESAKLTATEMEAYNKVKAKIGASKVVADTTTDEGSGDSAGTTETKTEEASTEVPPVTTETKTEEASTEVPAVTAETKTEEASTEVPAVTTETK